MRYFSWIYLSLELVKAVKHTIVHTTDIKALLFALLFVLYTAGAYAQGSPEQDCFNAIPVCQDIYNQPNSYSGQGGLNQEINSANSCLGAGELNSVWYIITVQSDGDLSFNITPNSNTDDYDWAVFNLTNSACTDIFNDPNLEVSCNFSGSTFPTGQTGPNGGLNPQDEDVIPVLAGETYVICVSNFSSTQNGYVLDFTTSTAQILDNIPPGVTGITSQIACGSTQITFSFSENVLCSSLQLADFQLNGPGGPYNLTNVVGTACQNGGAFEDEFTFTISPALTESGNYSLDLVGPVTDNCGNPAQFPSSFPFPLNAVTAVAVVTDEFCGQNDGAITINAQGGTAPYTYNWVPNVTGQGTNAATGLDSGNYTCTVADQAGCQAVVNVAVADPLSFTINVIGYNDTCRAGIGAGKVNITGGVGPFNILWTPSGQVTDSASALQAPGVYTVTVSDANNPTCQQQGTITIANISDVVAGITAEPPQASYLDPVINFKNTSVNADNYFWIFNQSAFDNTENPTHLFPPTPGIYPVMLIASSNRGCIDTATINIKIVYDLNFYVPSAFTPNGDNINEEFQVYSDGINYNDFELLIFDRWGHEVFATTNPFEKWNGAYFNKGEMLADGIYVYHVRFKQLYDDIEHTFIGRVALLK